jgi:hypothetical protein
MLLARERRAQPSMDGSEYKDQALLDQFDASSLYRTLEEEVVPLYFERDQEGVPSRWLARVQHCLATVPGQFNTNRMVLDYYERAYSVLSTGFEELRAAKRATLKAVVAEAQRVRKGFAELSIASAQVGDLAAVHVGDLVEVRVEVKLGSLKSEDIVLELVLGHANGDSELQNPIPVPLTFVTKTNELSTYEGSKSMERSGSFAYGIRARARAEGAHAAALRDLVLWA